VTFVANFQNVAFYNLADNSRQIECSTHPLQQRFLGGPQLWLNGGFISVGTASWTTTAGNPAAPSRFEVFCGERTHGPQDPTDVYAYEAYITAIQVGSVTRQ
jgi:hypothetical protein